MNIRKTRTVVAGVLCATTIFAVASAVNGNVSVALERAGGSSHSVAVSSYDPLPDTASEEGLRRYESKDSRTGTPGGFALQHPGHRRSDYVYDSDDVYQGAYHCTEDGCRLQGEVKVQFHEVSIGGSSHAWRLTLSMKEYKNPGRLTWSYFSTYWCGVNIKNSPDHECDSGAAPSGASMSQNTEVNKPWGASNGITVFPMVQATTQFSNGGTASTKFRGWDTVSRKSATKLADKSGTGD